jgi:hypothetical protein
VSGVWLAYFYQPTGIAEDGWRPRLTMTCDSRACIQSAHHYHLIRDEHWVFLSHHEIGKEPANVWEKARA